MEIKFIYKGKDFNDLENNVLSAYNEISGYFSDAPKDITVRIHKTKKISTYNSGGIRGIGKSPTLRMIMR